jgi:hypothetical protein
MVEEKRKEAQSKVQLVAQRESFTNEKCRKTNKRFKVFVVGIWNLEDQSGHALIAIADKKTKECELFDPHGAFGTLVYLQDRIVKAMIENPKLNLRGYNFLTTGEFCPVGPQYVLNKSLCHMFSLFYVWLRIRHPRVPRKDILDIYTKRTAKNLSIIMKNWQCYIIQSVKDRGIWDLVTHINGLRKNVSVLFRTQQKQIEVLNKLGDVEDAILETGNVEVAKMMFTDLVQKLDVY